MDARTHAHAPGFPPGCPDSGDVLRALTASGTPHELTLVVVTSALRVGVEEAGDHERGLDRVRASLARIGALCGPAWSPSYYGKDLVLVRPGRHDPAALRLPLAVAAGGVRHGWAWDRLVLPSGAEPGFAALLHACYAVSMAARLCRDEPLLPALAPAALATVPGRLTVRGTASLLAGVLVRPYGERAAGAGEDPRMPGVPSADGWPGSARAAAEGWLVMTDVHDIEWGTVAPDPTGSRVTAGNAQELLDLAALWQAGGSPAEVFPAAYRIRQRRERELVDHLAALAYGVHGFGTLHGTFGDGLCGLVTDPSAFRRSLARANRASAGRLASGAGAAPVGAGGIGAARPRAAFALHVTKTLKGTGQPPDGVQLFGDQLSRTAAEAALRFLDRMREAGPSAPGAHHLDHARRHREHWLRHLPASCRSRAADLLAPP
ncbi:hypothetical protein AB0C45_24590 [Streptomyces cyaneofuscatus]|uniref:hypothetical protein n=1 Tax=Streptomyces cyaneofuscatus TaxID=66883 RepID=UPI0033E3CA44